MIPHSRYGYLGVIAVEFVLAFAVKVRERRLFQPVILGDFTPCTFSGSNFDDLSLARVRGGAEIAYALSGET